MGLTMDWFTVHYTQLSVPPLSLIPPAPLGAWLRLHGLAFVAYKTDLIPDCEGWDDSTWLRACGLTKADVEGAIQHNLAAWRDDGLLLLLFDHEGIALYQRKSSGGKKGAAKRWGKAKDRTPIATPSGTAYSHIRSDQNKSEQKKGDNRENQIPFSSLKGRKAEEPLRKETVEEELARVNANAERYRQERGLP